MNSYSAACNGGCYGYAEDMAAYNRGSQSIQDTTFTRTLHMTDRLAYQKAFKAEIQDQENALAQTFQILLASVSIKESQNSIQQSRRGVLLTWLAFIYAPLTFVTGIFGMNVSEINGSRYELKVFGVALVLVLLCTVGLYMSYKGWEAWTQRTPPEDGSDLMLQGKSKVRNLLRMGRWIDSEKDPAKVI